MSLHNSKSPGPDGWPIPIIKSVSEFIPIPLSIIFSKSFNSGTLPHDWKDAQVTPIHKKGARNLQLSSSEYYIHLQQIHGIYN